jgi:hypothetical protein
MPQRKRGWSYAPSVAPCFSLILLTRDFGRFAQRQDEIHVKPQTAIHAVQAGQCVNFSFVRRRSWSPSLTFAQADISDYSNIGSNVSQSDIILQYNRY